jgi:hypothetical protein
MPDFAEAEDKISLKKNSINTKINTNMKGKEARILLS